jgi:hypothetical protein
VAGGEVTAGGARHSPQGAPQASHSPSCCRSASVGAGPPSGGIEVLVRVGPEALESLRLDRENVWARLFPLLVAAASCDGGAEGTAQTGDASVATLDAGGNE